MIKLKRYMIKLKRHLLIGYHIISILVLLWAASYVRRIVNRIIEYQVEMNQKNVIRNPINDVDTIPIIFE